MRYRARDLATGDISHIARSLGDMPRTTWSQQSGRDMRQNQLTTQSELLLTTAPFMPNQLDTIGSLNALFEGLAGAATGFMDEGDLNLLSDNTMDYLDALGGPKITRSEITGMGAVGGVGSADGSAGSVSFTEVGEGAVLAAQAAIAAGFQGEDLVMAVAIVGPESGWVPTLNNASSGATGLWQIMWRTHRDKGGGYSTREQLHDPFLNARVAYDIYKQYRTPGSLQARHGRWSDWAVHPDSASRGFYTSGNSVTSTSPRNWIEIARQAVAEAQGTVRQQAVPGQGGMPPTSSPSAARAVEVALAQIGKPYRWGGTGPSSFDCSGLMVYSWGQAGVTIPRSSRYQYEAARDGRSNLSAVRNRSQLRAGDLVFYHNPVSHVAMYLEGDKVVEAPNSGNTVRIRNDGVTRRGTRDLFGRVTAG